MKTISIKNPWGYLICSGQKDIENRTWQTNFRGRVLVHVSAKSINLNVPNAVFLRDQWNALSPDQKLLLRSNSLPKSAIIGSVEIVDCVVNHPSIWAEKRDGRLDSAKQWIEKPIYNWVLANPVLFAKPITNVKGKLSFWEYPMTEHEYLNIEKIGNPLIPDSINIRENGLKFTHIIIAPIVKNRKYLAYFSFGFGDLKMLDTTIAGNSPEECIHKTEAYFKTELKPEEYTIQLN